MREIHGFVAKSVANSCAYCYTRTVVPTQGISGAIRVVHVSNFNSPNLTTETPARH